MKKIIKIAIVTSSLLPLLALALADIGGIKPIEPKVTNLQTVINAIGNWATGLLISLSVLFVIYAAFVYLTAAGSEEKVKLARDVIIYAAISIAVALLAQVVKTVVQGLIK